MDHPQSARPIQKQARQHGLVRACSRELIDPAWIFLKAGRIKRANLGLIPAVTNRASCAGWCWTARSRRRTCSASFARLIRDADGKVFLILDRLPVHRSAMVRAWLAGCEVAIEVFYLPDYSRELNPDKGVNGDLKQAVTRQEPVHSKVRLKRAAIGQMRKLPKLPDRIRGFFGHRTFRYAA
jgi:hypothetical protein